MRRATIWICLIGAILVFTAKTALAENSPFMWVGEWTIHTNKGIGPETLIISDTKADCATSPWCSLVISIKTHDGKNLPGRIERMGNVFRYMIFSIRDGNITHNYSARIFVHRTMMAGNFSSRHPRYRIPSGVFCATRR